MDALHQALAVGAGAHYGGAVQVLKRPAHNLRSGGRTSVHEHHELEFLIQRRPLGAVNVHLLPVTAARNGHQRILRHEDGDYLGSLGEKSAAVPAKVEYELVHTLSLEFLHLVAHLVAHALGESALQNVARVAVKHSGIFDVRKMYLFAAHLDFQGVARIDFLYLELHDGARLSLHLLGAGLGIERLHVHAVYLQYLVAGLDARFHAGSEPVRLVDDHVLSLLLVDDGAHPGVYAAELHGEAFQLLFWHIDRVRVKFRQHSVYRRARHPVHRKRVHIGLVQFLDYGVLNLHPFAQFVILRLCDRTHRSERAQHHRHYPFHMFSSHL